MGFLVICLFLLELNNKLLCLDLFQGMSQLYKLLGGRKDSCKDEVHETWH